MAKKFTPIQAIGRPYSLPIETGVTLERGMGLWLNSSGQVTNVAANAYGISGPVIGLCDDVQTNPERYNVINEQHLFTITTVSSGVIPSTTVTLNNTGIQLRAGTTTSTDLIAAGVATLYVKVAGVYTVVTGNATVVISSDTNGVATVVSTTGTQFATPGAFSFKLVISYSYVVSGTDPLGLTTTLDMFDNNSTKASKLCTVFFEPGIYATDAYNPYVAYTPGASLYVMDGGFITSSVGSNQTAVVIGKIIKAPATNFSAEQQTVNNHQGQPELLTLWLNL